MVPNPYVTVTVKVIGAGLYLEQFKVGGKSAVIVARKFALTEMIHIVGGAPMEGYH